MARDMLEFSNRDDLQHLLQVSVADDFVRDYESTVKSITRSRKIYSWMSNGCSIAMLVTSFASGVTAFANLDPTVTMISGVAALTVGPMERAKAYADAKYKEATKDLAAAYRKCGLETFGIYDTDSPTPGGRSARSPRGGRQVVNNGNAGRVALDLEKLSKPLVEPLEPLEPLEHTGSTESIKSSGV